MAGIFDDLIPAKPATRPAAAPAAAPVSADPGLFDDLIPKAAVPAPVVEAPMALGELVNPEVARPVADFGNVRSQVVSTEDEPGELGLGEALFERAKAGLADTLGGTVQAIGEKLQGPFAALEGTALGELVAPAAAVYDPAIAAGREATELAAAQRAAGSIGAINPQSVDELASMAMADPEGALRFLGGIGAESAPAILLAMATRNPRAAERIMGLTTYGTTYGQQRAAGADIGEAEQQAIASALIEAASSRAPADVALGGVPFGRRLVEAPLLEGAGEATAGGIQSLASDVIAGRPVDDERAILEAAVGAAAGAPMGLGEAVLGRGPERAPAPAAPPAGGPAAPPGPIVPPAPAPAAPVAAATPPAAAAPTPVDAIQALLADPEFAAQLDALAGAPVPAPSVASAPAAPAGAGGGSPAPAGAVSSAPRRASPEAIDAALAMDEDAYIAAVNPEGKRSGPEDEIAFAAGDIDTPLGAQPAPDLSFTDKQGRQVDVFETADGLFAQVDGQTVGLIESRDGETLNQVAKEFQGAGIGAGLAKAQLLRDPMTPAGSFSEAGEKTRRAALRQLRAERAPAPEGLGDIAVPREEPAPTEPTALGDMVPAPRQPAAPAPATAPTETRAVAPSPVVRAEKTAPASTGEFTPGGKLFQAGKNAQALQLPDGSWRTRVRSKGQWQPWVHRETFDASPTFGYKPTTPPGGYVDVDGKRIRLAPKEAPSSKAPDGPKKPRTLLDVLARGRGLDRAAFEREGVDPKMLGTRAGFGYVFRKEGGMTPDELREMMVEEGYLPPDSPDRPSESDVSQALDLLFEALSGEDVFASDQADAVAAWQDAQRAEAEAWEEETRAVLDDLDDPIAAEDMDEALAYAALAAEREFAEQEARRGADEEAEERNRPTGEDRPDRAAPEGGASGAAPAARETVETARRDRNEPPPPTAAAPPAPKPTTAPTSTKNAVQQAERAERGADPILKAVAKTNEETLAEAQATLDADPDAGREVVERLKTEGPAVISLADEAVLLVEKVRLRNERDAAGAIASDPNATPEARAVARAKWEDAEARINDMDQATAASGREWGRLGQFRQRMLREDFTFAALERRERVRLERPLTSEESASLKEYADRVQRLEARLQETQTALDDATRANDSAVAYKALLAEMAKSMSPFKPTKAKLQENAAASLAALRESVTESRTPAQTDTPAFRRWFGDSKVVDADGKPLVVYHGSSSARTKFAKGFGDDRGENLFPQAFFFSPDRDIAQTYGDEVTDAFLRLENPFIARTKSDFDKLETDDAEADLRAAGHDGAILYIHPDGPPEYVVFDPSQIKSATGNRGTFDPASDSLLESRGVRRKDRPPLEQLDGGPRRSQLEADREFDETLEGARRNVRQLQAAVSPAAKAIRAALGPAARHVVVLNSQADLDPEVAARVSFRGRTDGFFDPVTGRAYVFADVAGTPERAVWVAMHETAGHLGLRGMALQQARGDRAAASRALVASLDRAAANPTVQALADKIAAENPDYTPERATEEALAELAAATRTGDYDGIQTRYGVTVPAAQRAGLRGDITRLVQAIRAFLQSLVGGDGRFTDAQVYRLLDGAWRHAQAAPVGQAGSEGMAAESRRAFSDGRGQRRIEHNGAVFVKRGDDYLLAVDGQPADFFMVREAEAEADRVGGEVVQDDPIDGQRRTWSVRLPERVRRDAEREFVPESRASGDLFGAPTQAERIEAERRRRDDERDGRTGTGRTDMAAGEGDLFAGGRPQQARLDESLDDFLDGSAITEPVYHGTTRAFDEFRPGFAPGWGEGIYFTDNREQAASDYGDTGRVIEAHVSIKNPWRGRGLPAGLEDTAAWKAVAGRWDYVEDAWQEDSQFVGDALRELGYDGVIAQDSNDIRGREVVVFSPAQVRIADTGNRVESMAGLFARTRGDVQAERAAIAVPEKISPDIPHRQDYSPDLTRKADLAIDHMLKIGGGTVLADRIARDFRIRGGAALIGRKITSPDELAAMAAAYRNPAWETLRYVFVDDDGVVKGETAVSARMPGTSSVFPTEIQNLPDSTGPGIAWLEDKARAVGATGMWMIHNHPSGNPEPSRADYVVTNRLATHSGIPVLGHVVLNHRTFAHFKPGAQSATIAPVPGVKAEDADPTRRQRGEGMAAQVMPLIEVDGPASAAAVAKDLIAQTPEDSVTVVVLSARREAQAIVTIPIDTLGKPRGAGLLAHLSRRSGSSFNLAVIHESAFNKLDKGDVRKAMRAGYFMDAVIVRADGSTQALAPLGQGGTHSDALLGRRGRDDRGLELYEDRPLESRAPVQTDTAAFKAWFGDSKVVDENGEPLRVYHGTKRPDRIGNRFRSARATSGPMAFFTDSPKLASNYATNKSDTSLEMPEHYRDWFKVKLPGQRSEVDIERAWHHLSPAQRADLADKLSRVTNLTPDGDEADGFRLGDASERGGPSSAAHWDHLMQREHRGNALATAVDLWLSGGNLFGQEERFLDVLRTAGMPGDFRLDDPNAEFPAVIPVYLRISNPFTTEKVQSVLPALRRAAARQRAPKFDIGVDQWDKRAQDPRVWMQRLEDDIAEGTTHAWTSIPDWVTNVLRDAGHDGIKDVSGKMGGEEHAVWIPFSDDQVKSAIGNRGTFKPEKTSILESRAPIDPVQFFHLSRIGALPVSEGVTDFAAWSARMKADLGDKLFASVESSLPEVFEASKLQATGRGGERAIDPENITSRDISDLARKHIQAGVRGEDAVMKAVHADIKELDPEMTERDVRRLFSEYGKVNFPSKEQDKVLLRELRSLVQIQESIDRLTEGLNALKSGPQRDKATQAIREKRRVLNDLLKQKVKAGGQSPEMLATYQQARIRNLQNQIEDLTKQIATGERPKRAKAPAPSLELQTLIAQRDALQAERDEIDSPRSVRENEAKKRALKKQIEAIQEKLAGKAKPKPGAVQGPDDAAVTALRDELAKARTALKALNRRPAMSPEQRFQSGQAKSIQRQLNDVQARLAANDYARRPRPEPKELNQANTLAKVALMKVKAEFARRQFESEMAKRHPVRKILGAGAEAINLSRAYLTSLDFSALLRQGGFIALGHPVRAAKAVPAALRAFASEAGAVAAADDVFSRPNARLYKKYGLELTQDGGISLSKMEEVFMSRWLQRMPRFLAGGLVRGSGRAFTATLNRIRADSFDAMAAALGLSRVLTDAEGEAIANYINVATGRGHIGRSNAGATGLNTVFFAPRLVASRVNLLALQPLYGGTARTRLMIAQEYSRFLMGVAVVFGLAALAADDDDDEPLVTLDPRSANFLKIKFNNTYIDPMTGLSQVTVFLTRMLTGETVSGAGQVTPLRERYRLSDFYADDPLPAEIPYGRDDAFDVAARFARTKFAPIPGAIASLGSGTDPVGEPVTVGSVVTSLVVPISFQDIHGIMTDNGLPKGAGVFLLSMLGMGVQYREPDINTIRNRLADTADDELEAEFERLRADYPAEATEGQVLDRYVHNAQNRREGRAGKVKRDDQGRPKFKMAEDIPPAQTQAVGRTIPREPQP